MFALSDGRAAPANPDAVVLGGLFVIVAVVVGRSMPGGKTVDQPATNSSSVTPNPDIQQNH